MKMLVYRPGVEVPETVDVPGKTWADVKPTVIATIGCKYAEHVAVLFEGKRRDMFVDESSANDGLPINSSATWIYWASDMARGKVAMPDWPHIHGVAVLFPEDVVWS
jgi:hypothetical protein